jgi:hypothetical protein
MRNRFIQHQTVSPKFLNAFGVAGALHHRAWARLRKFFRMIAAWLRPETPDLKAVGQPKKVRNAENVTNSTRPIADANRLDYQLSGYGITPPPRHRSAEPRRKRKQLLDSAAPRATAAATPTETLHNEDSGVFYFRGAVLEQLDRSFRIIARLRLHDDDAYELYSRIGATVVPERAVTSVHRLPAIWNDSATRPTFGCITTVPTDQQLKERLTKTPSAIYPKLFYFTKVELPPPHVEPTTDGDVYEVVAYFDELPDETNPKSKIKQPAWVRRHGFSFRYFIAVDTKTAAVRLLRELQTTYTRIRYRAGETTWSNSGNHRTRVRCLSESIPWKHWAYNPALVDWYKARKREYSIERFAESLFAGCANFSIASEFGTRINVHDKNGNTCVFCIDQKRTAYFFKDRDPVLTPRGAKARIFHVVKPHTRTLPNGKQLYTRMHFRGLRRFDWGPYRVTITVPGLHHMPITEFTAGFAFDETLPPEERHDGLHAKDIGRALGRIVEGDSVETAFRAEELAQRVRDAQPTSLEAPR